MEKDIFSKSENFKQEYSCKVIRMGEMKPIEGSDFLAQTIVDGFSMVVRKDEFKEGDVLFYASNESELAEKFVANNNLFDMETRKKNVNYKEVEKVIEEQGKDAAKRMVGFFNKYGRVKMIRLKGCPSMGFLFGLDTMAKWKSSVAGINLEDYLDTEFDTVDGELFIKAYVPRIHMSEHKRGAGKPRKMKKIEGTYKVTEDFHRHYDTNPLQKNMHCIKPDDVVSISVKVHGTSVIIGNQRVIRYRAFNLKEKRQNQMVSKEYRMMRHHFLTDKGFTYKRFLKEGKNIRNKRIPQPFDSMHRVVYSSRNVVQNKEFNRGWQDDYNFYKSNVYEEYGKMLGKYIPEGWTIYGEIFGYVTGDGTKYIQGSGKNGYDYGCEQGTNKMMPYRITVLNEQNNKFKELNVEEVNAWTNKLLKQHPELKERITPMTMLYHGTLKDLYPEVNIAEHWNENVLECIKNDKEHFGMEGNEPMCKNKVAREGIVVRIDDDLISEAFKCKCVKFLDKEKELMDKGIVDNEMLETNY